MCRKFFSHFFYFCGLNKQTATYLFTLIFNIITLINMTSFQKLLNFIYFKTATVKLGGFETK